MRQWLLYIYEDSGSLVAKAETKSKISDHQANENMELLAWNTANGVPLTSGIVAGYDFSLLARDHSIIRGY